MSVGQMGPAATEMLAQAEPFPPIRHPASAPELGHHETGEIDEGPGCGHIRDVETVDIGSVDPVFQFVSDVGGSTDENRPTPADPDFLRQLTHRPGTARILGKRGQRGTVGIGLDMPQRLVRPEPSQINSRPATK